MENGIFLLLGSNLGDRLGHLNKTKAEITSAGTIQTESAIYKTAPWGIADQPDFLNQVIRITTSLSPDNLLTSLLLIERKIGRVRRQKWGARVIDIDILFYNQLTVDNEHLIIPHPAIPRRRFTLEPMAEIAPYFYHPLLKKNMLSLLQDCEDTTSVEKYIL